jgi:hypothetical protein
MNRNCWDPGSYTAVSFACVPTGNAVLMMCNLTYNIHFMLFFNVCNKLHMNKDCTAI